VDSGVGIAPELLPDIFDLFMQADRSLDRAQGGLGIGLTLVRNLVELHGGTVEAHSAGPGHGSEFVVSLPALAAAPEGAKASASAQTALPVLPTVSAARVLVVDDNVDAAETLADLLDLWGHPVCTVHDGAAALEQAESFQPAVVLLDIGLPGIDGYEVAQRLRRDQGYCGLLIALTGYGQDEDRRRSEEAGFDHHLTKPVDPEVLRALLTSPPRVP
jgi:CheY-like chemotaxis protein